ncbi:major capsid protein [Breoghania sp.]|uniref:major capsid protein n=1 Tax=Breoghania sp. TaxID=2065378 RepID=UPI002AA6BA9A|nr:major capsid protein [Breoghania sp.]
MDMNIFNDDAFAMVAMTEALEDLEYVPGFMGSMNLFEDEPVTTEMVAVEKRGTTLNLIKTTERGSPIEEGRREGRDIRGFSTSRIAKGHTLRASEIQGIREFGTERDVETMVEYIARYSKKLSDETRMTWEFQMLGAVQGIVLDADGSLIINWFSEFGIAQPAEIDFALGDPTTIVELKCRQVQRAMISASGRGWVPGARVVGLCGDEFFDKLTTHNSTREIYLNQSAAGALGRAFGPALQAALGSGAYATFDHGGVIFVNYRGAEDFDATAEEGTVEGKEAFGIATDKAKFFPVGVPGIFKRGLSPAESFDYVNTPGLPMYQMLIRDDQRNMWARPEIYSYPLYMCKRPEMLLRATVNAG